MSKTVFKSSKNYKKAHKCAFKTTDKMFVEEAAANVSMSQTACVQRHTCLHFNLKYKKAAQVAGLCFVSQEAN